MGEVSMFSRWEARAQTRAQPLHGGAHQQDGHDDWHEEHDRGASSYGGRLFLSVRGGGTTSETARPIDQHRNAPYPEEKEETGEESPSEKKTEHKSTGSRHFRSWCVHSVASKGAHRVDAGEGAGTQR